MQPLLFLLPLSLDLAGREGTGMRVVRYFCPLFSPMQKMLHAMTAATCPLPPGVLQDELPLH